MPLPGVSRRFDAAVLSRCDLPSSYTQHTNRTQPTVQTTPAHTHHMVGLICLEPQSVRWGAGPAALTRLGWGATPCGGLLSVRFVVESPDFRPDPPPLDGQAVAADSRRRYGLTLAGQSARPFTSPAPHSFRVPRLFLAWPRL